MTVPSQDDPSQVRLVDRKLSDSETDAIRALVTSLLRRDSVQQMFEEEDISDIAAYCIAMLSNEKTIAYVVEELAVFFAETDPSLGPELGQQLQQYLVEHVLTPPEKNRSSNSPGNALTLSGALEASRESKSHHKQAFERLTSSSAAGRGGSNDLPTRRGGGRGDPSRGRGASRAGGRGEGPRGRRHEFRLGGQVERPSHGGRDERARVGRGGSRRDDLPRGGRDEPVRSGRGDARRDDRPRVGRGRGKLENLGTSRFEGRPSSMSGHRHAREDEYEVESRALGRQGGRGEWNRGERASSGRGDYQGVSAGRGDSGGRLGGHTGGRGDRLERFGGNQFEGAPEAKRMRRHTQEDQLREDKHQNHHQQTQGYEAGGFEANGSYDDFHQSEEYDRASNQYEDHYYQTYVPRGTGRGRSVFRGRGGRGRFTSSDPATPHPSPIVAAAYRGGRGGRALVVKSMIASKTWVRNKAESGESTAPSNEGGGGE